MIRLKYKMNGIVIGEEMLDAAALVQELDLVVTSDTVTAHLAGALGRPVWLMEQQRETREFDSIQKLLQAIS